LGVTTTIAVILHEIPQKLGDFGVIVHFGYAKFQAALSNFYSTTTAIIGTIIVLILGSKIKSFGGVLVPLTAGGFIYIALSGLVPEIHKEENIQRSFVQFIFILLGISTMVFLLGLE
jgi:zinc and cadmium transporter